MSALRLVPAYFSLLLVAALLMRLGFPLILIVPLTLMLMGALLVPWRQVRAVMAGVLWLLAALWAFMTYVRVMERYSYGEKWSRLAGILLGVTAFTFWSGWLVWGTRKNDPGHPEA
jgi:hypothetical protein